MSKYRILKPEQSYTFSQYFLLPNPTIDVIAEFEYSYDRTELELPKHFGDISYLEFLQNYLQRNIKVFAHLGCYRAGSKGDVLTPKVFFDKIRQI
jgi:hypothetical protein